MGYYLLDNPNPHGSHFYSSRRAKPRVIVLHITAGLEDLDMRGDDVSAEQTARYAATTERQVSWHAGADSDSWLSLLPAGYTAWHASNYNSLSWGLEISKRDTTWSDEPEEWVEATLRNAAAACRPVAEQYDIPLRLLTRAQVDAGMSGFTYHMWLDPTRRSDPGKDFPIDRFFALMRGEEDWFDMATKKELEEILEDKLNNTIVKHTDKNVAWHFRGLSTPMEYRLNDEPVERTPRQAWAYTHGHAVRMRGEVRAVTAAVAANGAALDALAKALAEHDGQLDPEAFAATVREASEAGAKAALESVPLAAVLVREETEEDIEGDQA